jgi:invasion protein IalB
VIAMLSAPGSFATAVLIATVAASWATSAYPQPQVSGATLLGVYGDWRAFSAQPDGKKTCFVLTKPNMSKTEPPGRERDQPYLFISTRPAEKVRNEVSVIIGYPFKQGADATAEIGTAKFAMYTQDDGAWIKNIAEEQPMVDAMRKGVDLIFKGTSRRGTRSTDYFLLKGLSEALARSDQECK